MAVNGHDQIVVLPLVVVGRELHVQRGPARRRSRPHAPSPTYHGRGQVGHLEVVPVLAKVRHRGHVPLVHAPGRRRRLQQVRGLVLLHDAPGGRRLDEAQRQREDDPARERSQKQQLPLTPSAGGKMEIRDFYIVSPKRIPENSLL